MASAPWNSLLDVPPFPEDGYAGLADRFARLLGTRHDLVFVQAEAIVALEATALSLARPGLVALNIVTSMYGRWFGEWLRRGAAEVVDLAAEPGRPITVAAVAAALGAMPRVDIVAVAHAESATGILNPLPEIVGLARKAGAVIVVDAVASIGGHPLDLDSIDVGIIGPQKGLGGSSGLSALTISAAAWRMIEAAGAPLLSTLSLLDLKRNWLDAGRGALPGMPAALEFHALDAAITRASAEGLDAIVARHARAGGATRDGLRALGVPLWTTDATASNLVTATVVPDGIETGALLAAAAQFDAGLSPGVGEAGAQLLRLNHTGQRARPDVVLANVLAYGEALTALGHQVDITAAADAVSSVYNAD